MKKHIYWILFLSICLVALSLRFYNLTSPVADWHSWRQADTAAVARNFIKFGIDPMHPRYDDLSNIQSGKDNPNGWRMVEFPLYQLLGVSAYRIFSLPTIEIALRLISIFSSIGTIILIGLLLKRFGSNLLSLSGAAFYAFLPYSIYYSRTILPESLMLFLSLLAVYLSFVAFDKKGIVRECIIVLAAVFASLALLTKPYAVFVLLPMSVPFLWNFRLSFSTFIRAGFVAAITLIPLYLWRQWILHYPEGIPAYTWLFNEGNIRFKPAWVRWLFIERIGKLIFGVWGTVFLVLGAIEKKKFQEFTVVFLFLIGSLSYMTILARGNVQHDYYQIIILPTLSIIAGYGLAGLFRGKSTAHRIGNGFIAIIIVGLTLFSSWYDLRGFYWVNHPEIVAAGKEADVLLPKDAKVIAPYGGDTSFLYQTNRQGWPIGFEIDKKIKMGAQYYVTVSPTDNDGETKDLASRYTVLVRNDTFAIIDLTKPLRKSTP